MEGDADVIEAPGFRLRLGARPVLDENILPHRLALLAGVRPAFGGKTRVMAPLFPSRDFNCRNVTQTPRPAGSPKTVSCVEGWLPPLERAQRFKPQARPWQSHRSPPMLETSPH